MTDKIKQVSKSIKSKLSFEEYKPAEQPEVKTEEHKDVLRVKVKRTFYIDKDIAEKLDTFYAKRLLNKKPVDKSDIVAYALEKMLDDEDADIPTYSRIITQ